MSKLAASGFDYIALGYAHTPQILLRDTAMYCGSLEPVSREDLGAHGYIEGQVENGKIKTKFVPFAIRSYEQLLLNVTEETTQVQLEENLKEQIFQRGGLNIYRVILQGERSAEVLLIPEKLKAFGNITEVLDETKPAYDLKSLRRKYAGTLIGDYIDLFMEKERNIVEEKAFFYGLQALLETSV